MNLAQRLAEYVRACFTGLWLETHEQDDALVEMAQLCRQENWRLATWDIDQGLVSTLCNAESTGPQATDPLAAIRAASALATPDGTTIVALKNFHRFLGSAEIVQALAHQVAAGKQQRVFFVILAPVVQVPVELEKQFVVLEHELPPRDQLEELARGIATEEGELPDGDELGLILDAAAGLTRYEAEGAFSLALVRHGRIVPQTIWELKSQTLTKSGLLQLHQGSERFDGLGGLSALKEFCLRALRPRSADTSARPRGILLLSPPGCGKGHFAKALGHETNRPTLTLDLGALMGSLVGQTEQNVRQALRIADAMAPCILFCDEIEKALAGVAGSGQTDSGVSARMFGTLLTWLSDHTSDVFVVASANDIRALPPEFARAERFDGVFFIDLPDAKSRQSIWDIYIRAFALDGSQARPQDSDWTGAEIRSCCRLAALLDMSLVEAARHVVPVARTSAEAVDRLRQWASGRCLSADTSGVFQIRGKGSSGGTSSKTRSRPAGGDYRLN